MECYFGMGTNCSDKVSKDYIAVNNFGYYKNLDKELKTLRLEGRFDFQIIYIEKGQGNFLTEAGMKSLGSGSFFIYHPGEKQIYSFSKGSSFYWLHFSGTGIKELLENLKLTKSFYTTKGSAVFPHEIKKMTSFSAEDGFILNSFLSGELLVILAQLSKSLEKREENISQTIYLMTGDTKNELSNKDYAKACGMSEYHFIRKFKEATGLSPHRYKIKQLILKAENMLLQTNLSISEVARLSGFSDSLYFSRIFKNETGMSPSEYRKKGQ